MSKVSVIGIGYVGLVTAVCLADADNKVVCIDKDLNKIEMLRNGNSPIFEPELEELITKNIEKKNLIFKTEIDDESLLSDTIFIAVGTPMIESTGRADLSYVFNVAEELGTRLGSLKGESLKTIVLKSTVPPGTTLKVKKIIESKMNGSINIVFNPEFLREGTAIKDTFYPDRIVFGAESEEPVEKLKTIYKKMVKQENPQFVSASINSAELIKYASNAFLATKISFINEIANLCELIGANVGDVAEGVGLDKRIGKSFLNAGIGYGGSCFPKDTRALDHLAGDHGHVFQLLKAVIDVNNMQKKRFVNKIKKVLDGVEGKRIGVLGLAFKQDTDDVRESIAIDIVDSLAEAGAKVSAHDPLAEKNAKVILSKHKNSIVYCDTPYDAAKKADALIIATEWDSFKKIDLEKIKKSMNKQIIFDGRNMLDAKEAVKLGFDYHSIGGYGN
jgi:UDPglucose 6-dehydrogenase